MNKAIPLTATALICIGRVIRMTRTTMTIAKGVGAAVALGAAVGLAGSCLTSSRNRSTMKKTMRKAARKMEHLMGGMTHMIG